jgi:hypothetical protein
MRSEVLMQGGIKLTLWSRILSICYVNIQSVPHRKQSTYYKDQFVIAL